MRISTRSNRSKLQRRDAAAAVEMAIVFAFILAPIVLGIIELSRALSIKDQLAGAVRSASAVAIRPGSDNAAIRSNVATVISAMGYDSTLATTTIKVNNNVADAKTAVMGDKISVTISLPARQLTWSLSFFLGKNATISETLVMMRQG